MEWCYVWWPWLTSKRGARWASCYKWQSLRPVWKVREDSPMSHESDTWLGQRSRSQGGGGILWQPPAYSLFKLLLSSLYRWCKLEGSVLFQRQKQLDTTVKTTIRAVIKWRCFLTRTSPSTLIVLEEEYVRRWTVPLVWIGNSYSWNVCRACRLYVTSTSGVRSLSTSLNITLSNCLTLSNTSLK